MLAGLVHGTFGIGFPMVATPLLALYTDVFTAVLITLLPTMAVNLVMILRGGLTQLNQIRPHLLVLPFSLIGTLIGSVLLLWLDPRPFLLLLSIAILLYLNQDRLDKFDIRWVRQNTVIAYVLFGLVAGLMAGTVNVMLPVLIILFMELQIASSVMVVLFNLNFFTGKLTQSLFFLQADILGIESFILSTLWLVPAAIVSLVLGMHLSKYISASRYVKILRGVLWTMSGILVVRFLHSYL
jgi:hypothetical protein